MRTHIDLLGLLFVLAGLLSWTVAAAVTLLGAGAVSMAWSLGDEAGGGARSIALVFFVVATLVAMWGGANVVAGRAIRRLKVWGRVMGLALAVVHLFVLPFGTALGAYALWVLVGNETRRTFEAPTSGTVP